MDIRWNTMATRRMTNEFPTDTLRDMPMNTLWKRMPISSRTTCISDFFSFSSGDKLQLSSLRSTSCCKVSVFFSLNADGSSGADGTRVMPSFSSPMRLIDRLMPEERPARGPRSLKCLPSNMVSGSRGLVAEFGGSFTSIRGTCTGEFSRGGEDAVTRSSSWGRQQWRAGLKTISMTVTRKMPAREMAPGMAG